MKRCPIKRFKDSLIEQNIFSEAKLNDINLEIMNTVKTTWDIALNDPWPEENLFGTFISKKMTNY